MQIEEVSALGEKIRSNVARVIAGKDETVAMAVTALLAGGHLLLDDVPGTGKTMMAKSLARSLDADFKRVQFTPDLLPSDLDGINFFNQKEGEFTFRRGPVFTNILLADEINRATPRTQSSLLECMEERQVTVDGLTYPLNAPYFVVATQNPVETQGTFPLPEAQLDRFLLCTSVGYPSTEAAAAILRRFDRDDPFESLSPVCAGGDIAEAQKAVCTVYVHPDLADYIVAAVEKTREQPGVELGVSPRGSLAMLRASKARAALLGRSFVTPEDVKYLAPFVFCHRMIMRDDFGSGVAAKKAVDDVLSSVAVPSENWDGER